MKDQIKSLPHKPGCYLYKNGDGEIIYIGKAKDLKKRVNSYFTSKAHDEKTLIMISHARTVEYIITDNEVEALILENNLIKEYRPRYNIDLKDSKRYAYIQVTKEEYPRLLVARTKTGQGRFYGPFVSAADRDYVKKLLIKTFRLRTCKKIPKRPCLRSHINLCLCPCIANVSHETYMESIRDSELVLQGNTEGLIEGLKEKMAVASERLEYEKALVYRNQISAVSYLNERQKMERQKRYDEDIINYVVRDNIVHLQLFSIHKGILTNRQEFEFEEKADFLEEFMLLYYSDNLIPSEVIIPAGVSTALCEVLKEKKGGAFRTITPLKGEKKSLLTFVKKNIESTVFGHIDRLNELMEALNLLRPPEIIECFDISHLSGTNMVGSMVQFKNGSPNKQGYRRFRLKTVNEINDVAAIGEVVRRRYLRVKAESSQPPDLIIIDGGAGQLESALSVLRELDLTIPAISIAKRFEEIYMEGISRPLRLSRKGEALKLIQAIRDEAHRFAIKYHKLLRGKGLKK